MASPSYICRIAFASQPFDAVPTWVDVSADLMSFHIRRGRQWELNRMEPGTATVRLRNLPPATGGNGSYWPDNSTGAYYPNVLPWKRINIQATWNAVTYDLYTGYIESWQPDFIMRPIKAPVMDLSCSDGIKSLSQRLLNNTTGYASELSGTRFDNVLSTCGWPAADRTLDAGQTTIQATGAITNLNAMTHLYTVEDSELGILYESPSGSMVFQDRHARFYAPYTVSQATFGDTLSAGELGYTQIELSFEDLRISNDIRVTMLGGTEQVATDTTSADAYGTRSLQRPSLLMPTDAEALAQAQYLLARYKTPVMRCKQIVIRPNSDPTNLYPKVLSYDISTRLTIKLAQASLDKDYHIEGINHDWDVQDAAGLKTSWMLTDATSDTIWIWDTSVWDGPDVWGY